MRLPSLIVCLTIFEAVGSDQTEHSKFHKSKRQVNSLPLVFPYGAIIKLILGMTSPVENLSKDGISLIFLSNFQYQYQEFANISELSQYYFIKEVSREEREADMRNRRDERLIFYRSFANLLDLRGLNGMECVLRAICEAAQYAVEDQGLVGDIMHILLTPDYGRTAFDEDLDLEWEETMSEFTDAAKAGRQMFSCPSIFSNCPEGQGVLELISVLRDET